MNNILRPYLWKIALVFFNDILIYSKSLHKHVQHVKEILEVLQQHHLCLRTSKCFFAQIQIAYLCHIMSTKGVAVDPEKIITIKDWPILKNIKQLRSFIRLIGYYRKFVPNYAKLVAPLTELLVKEKFYWDIETQKAFNQLKEATMTLRVLTFLDFFKQFIVETYASSIIIGAILLQEFHPISFFSKKVNTSIQKASNYAKELYTIKEAIKKWIQHLLGAKFIIWTHQKSIKRLCNKLYILQNNRNS